MSEFASSSSSSASSSSSSSVIELQRSHAGEQRSALSLCKRISKKLCVGLHASIACADHHRASECMEVLKNRLLDPSEPSLEPQCLVMLTCTGIHLSKRVVCGGEPEQATKDLNHTMALLFVLILLAHRKLKQPPAPTGTPATPASEGEEEEEEAMMEVDDDEDAHSAETREAERALARWRADSWRHGLAEQKAVADDLQQDDHRASTICRLCLCVADARADTLTLADAVAFAHTFFHQSSMAASLQLLAQQTKTRDDDFLTLSAASVLVAANDKDTQREKLAAIADIAESEAGQAVLRDLILSFTLPREVLETRKTCLLTRECNNRATKEFPTTLGEAHDAAMRGAEYSFADDPNEIHKTCALLAGIAVCLTKNAQSIRKDDAFRGRVSLPFLETRCDPCDEFKPRMQFTPDTREWIIYKLKPGTNLPNIEFKASGFEGFCRACILFMQSVDQV